MHGDPVWRRFDLHRRLLKGAFVLERMRLAALFGGVLMALAAPAAAQASNPAQTRHAQAVFMVDPPAALNRTLPQTHLLYCCHKATKRRNRIDRRIRDRIRQGEC